MPAVTESKPPSIRTAAIFGADLDRHDAFLPWIDHLFEVGDRIRKLRAHALETAAEAASLELHAARLRLRVDLERVEIRDAVERHWSPADIQGAFKIAELRSGHFRQLRAVPDAPLAQALEPLDGTHLASEALAAFAAVRLPARDAPEAEIRAALDRARAWHDLAAKPVLTRLNAASRGLESAGRGL